MAGTITDSDSVASALVAAVGEAFICIDPECHILEWNRAAERTYGWAFEEVIGENLLELVVPENARGPVHRAMAEWIARATNEEFETRVLTRTGRERVICWKAVRVSFAQEAPGVVIAVGHDVTDRRRAAALSRGLEIRLSLARKVISLGLLSKSIEHHIDKLLARILSKGSLAPGDLPGDSDIRSTLLEIEDAASRASELCGEIQAVVDHPSEPS